MARAGFNDLAKAGKWLTKANRYMGLAAEKCSKQCRARFEALAKYSSTLLLEINKSLEAESSRTKVSEEWEESDESRNSDDYGDYE